MSGPFPWATDPIPVLPDPATPPVGDPPAKSPWPNIVFWLLTIVATWLGQHIQPPSTEPPGSPPVVVDPGAPVVNPPITDRVVFDAIRKAANELPAQCWPDMPKIADNYALAATLIEQGKIRTDVEVGGWLRIEHRRDSTDEAAWSEFGRKQQRIWTDFAAGQTLTLAQWQKILRDTAQGIMTAYANDKPSSGPQPTPAGHEA